MGSGRVAAGDGTWARLEATWAGIGRCLWAMRRMAGFADLIDDPVTWPPPGGGLPDRRIEACRRRAMELLGALRRATPEGALEDSGEVFETFTLTMEDSGEGWLEVANVLGGREVVTTFRIGKEEAPKAYALWCRCRLGTPPEETPWDAARKGRRVADAGWGLPSLIDAGAHWICDLAAAKGAVMLFTCEGHPGGAYASMRATPEAGEVVALLRRTGHWRIEASRHGDRVGAYMKKCASVADRDLRWRDTSLLVAAAEAGADVTGWTRRSGVPAGKAAREATRGRGRG